MARTLAAALATHLEARAFLPVDLYELTVGGTTYRFTTNGTNLTGVSPATVATFTAGVMQSGAQRQAAGLVVDDLDVTVLHGGSELLGGVSWVSRAILGDFDGAPFVRYEGWVSASTGLLVGCVEAFRGEVSSVEPTSTQLRLVVAVSTERFKDRFPGLIVSPGCAWDFGSDQCGFAGTIDFTATLATGSTATKIYVTAIPNGLPTLTPGMHQFLAGYATFIGASRTVVDVGAADPIPYLVVSPPFPAGVIEASVGSSISLRAGCSKTAAVCDAWWDNLEHFLGAPAAPSSTEAT